MFPSPCATAAGHTFPPPPLKMAKEYTYQDVAGHNTKKDILVVIHDKVYDASKFIDEHP